MSSQSVGSGTEKREAWGSEAEGRASIVSQDVGVGAARRWSESERTRRNATRFNEQIKESNSTGLKINKKQKKSKNITLITLFILNCCPLQYEKS